MHELSPVPREQLMLAANRIGPRTRNRHLLRIGHGGGRHGGAAPLRLSRGNRVGLGALGGLRLCRSPDAHCGRDRGEIRHRCGDALVGEHRGCAERRGITQVLNERRIVLQIIDVRLVSDEES
jgi:hypothetical protein